MLDESSGQSRLIFTGHSGPVYGTNFSLDKRLLISCSADGSGECSYSNPLVIKISSEIPTVRLWSLQTWTNLVVYRLCDYPMWDVKFWWVTIPITSVATWVVYSCSPYGYYFVTGSADKYACLWAMDRQQPLRQFLGHDSDVNVYT